MSIPAVSFRLPVGVDENDDVYSSESATPSPGSVASGFFNQSEAHRLASVTQMACGQSLLQQPNRMSAGHAAQALSLTFCRTCFPVQHGAPAVPGRTTA